nr:hypothetical protein Itr_chr05CG15250 [Ipomoea trifida]
MYNSIRLSARGGGTDNWWWRLSASISLFGYANGMYNSIRLSARGGGTDNWWSLFGYANGMYNSIRLSARGGGTDNWWWRWLSDRLLSSPSPIAASFYLYFSV